MTDYIYFADKVLSFSDSDCVAADLTLRASDQEPLTRAKIQNFFEKYDSVALFSEDIAHVFKRFTDQFVPVVAAGGLVRTPDHRALMIYRNGRWDLPKGHHEAGESIEQCALREVEEETGIRPDTIVRPLCQTLHANQLFGRWELKCTHWFEMSASQAAATVPQQEEGIASVAWCTPIEVADHLRYTFPTIRTVFAALDQ